ncbi:MAG: hypothetical protein JST42_27680 [Bacteroidetes bacterium]|nr:hypothetical protein [Bacteroidota bacterium]
MPKNFVIKQLKDRFGGQLTVSREELFDFYREFEPDLNDSTFGWRIYALKEKNLVKPVRRGVYTLMVKQPFHPVVENRQKELAAKIAKQFPATRHCTWNTKWLSEWTTHQPGRFLILAEAEASATESVFYFLKDSNYKNVYLNPDEILLERYIYEEPETIIVKTLVSKAPLKKERQVTIPTAEKILVDLFIDRHLFAPFQGSELINIFNNVYKEYALNISRLLAYARRRNKEQSLLDYITRNTLLKELINE